MPTNRTKRTRDRVGAGGLSDAAFSYFWWEGTIHNEWAEAKTLEEIKSFWKENRRAILDWYIEKVRLRKWDAGRRPSFFWDEIKEARRKTGNEGYFKPMSKDGQDTTEYFEDIYETDYQFLKRLNLLEGWEKEIMPAKGNKGREDDERI